MRNSRIKKQLIYKKLSLICLHLSVYCLVLFLVHFVGVVSINHSKLLLSSCPYSLKYSSNISEEIIAAVKKSAKKYEVNPQLIYSVISVESSCRPKARSSKGAAGLMQLMPGTAKELGVTNPYDIDQNISGGTKYLAKLLKYFDGDTRLALAAYNAGPGAVKKFGNQIPPYPETLRYVEKVFERMKLQEI